MANAEATINHYRLRYPATRERRVKIAARELDRAIAELGWTKLRSGEQRNEQYTVWVAVPLTAEQVAETLCDYVAELPDIAAVGEPVDRDTLRREITAAAERIRRANTTLLPGT